MKWNWKHKNWPKLSFDRETLLKYEKAFLQNSGVLFGSLKHIREQDQDILKMNLISNEAFKTSQIEGEILDRDSLHSSIQKHFGLKVENRKVSPAEHGISEMVMDLYKNYAKPLSHHQLFEWHEMLTNGRRDLQDVGRYRRHEDPMQIVSGPMGRPTIHFEAPPSANVPDEMDVFISWFNNSEKKLGTYSPLIRSGMAHLYFESIHPFEDGNGRIGRAISEKALSQSLKQPTLIALAHTIETAKQSYYLALHDGSLDLDITEWLVYFSKLILKAQDYTQSMIDFLIEKGKFYAKHSTLFNARQEKVIARIFQEGIDGFKGGLSAENYISISGASASTATRDLQRLVQQGALKRLGERKSTRYFLNINHKSADPFQT